MTACLACGHDPGEVAVLGGLRIATEPPAAFWRGQRLTNLTSGDCCLLLVLARTGRASHFALLAQCTRPDTAPKTLEVRISKLRPRLPDGLRIVTERGWGYRLEVDA